MALRIDKVRELFAVYSGEEMNEEEQRGCLCVRLCRECADWVGEQLERSGRPAEEEGLSALESWAAAEAFYQLTLTDEATAPEKVSADGVEIVSGERSRKARALADAKRRLASAVLREGDFFFGRI